MQSSLFSQPIYQKGEKFYRKPVTMATMVKLMNVFTSIIDQCRKCYIPKDVGAFITKCTPPLFPPYSGIGIIYLTKRWITMVCWKWAVFLWLTKAANCLDFHWWVVVSWCYHVSVVGVGLALNRVPYKSALGWSPSDHCDITDGYFFLEFGITTTQPQNLKTRKPAFYIWWYCSNLQGKGATTGCDHVIWPLSRMWFMIL